MGMVQLVVSELVTNARKYAPGPCLPDLEIVEGGVQISVWDSTGTECEGLRPCSRGASSSRPRTPDGCCPANIPTSTADGA
jgi:hypothetical protein